MADDYSINATITADASGYEDGVKRAQKATKNLSKSVSGIIQGLGKSGLVGALGAVGLATNGVTAVLGVAKKTFQQVSRTVNECTEAYKKQYKAEIALETVAKNNPFVNGENVKSLKNFASEIQQVSNYGDEELIPLMANLTALGRTEAQTMQIIKTATDMASTGMVSLDTAVNQLNMTLNGNIGRLGVQNAELKDFTDEELKSGKAIEILSKKYDGLSQSMADSSIQMKNAIGDFKELIGESFEKAFSPMRKYFTEIITKTNNAISKAREHKKAVADVFTDEGDVKTGSAQTTNLQQSLIDLQKEYEKAYREQQQYLRLYGQYIDQTTDATALAYERDIKAYENKIKKITDELLLRKKANEEATKEAERAKNQAEIEKEISDLKKKYADKIAEQETKWANIALITKEEVTNEEKLKFYQEQLVAIMTEAGGQISTNNQYYKDQMKIINELIAKTAENPSVSSEWIDRLKEQRIEALEDERDRAIQFAENEGKETYSIWRYYNAQILELKLEQLEKAKKAELEAEGLSAEDKLAIEEYFKKESEKIYTELGVFKARKLKEESDALSESLAKINNVFVKKMMEIWKKFSDFINKDNDFYKSLVDKINDVKDRLKGQIKDIMKSLYDNTIGKLIDLIPDSVKKVLSNIGGVIKGVIKQLGKFFAPIIKFCGEVVTTIGKLFVAGVKAYVKMIQTAINTIYKILKSAFDIFKKLIDFNISDTLDVLLKFEDSVLTFFVETLPKLPQFVSTVLRSINIMLSTLINSVKAENVATVIYGILDELANNLPNIVQNILTIIQNMISFSNKNLADIVYKFLKILEENAIPVIEGLLELLTNVIKDSIDGLFKWLDEGGLQSLLKLALKIQTSVQDVFMKLLTSVADLLENHTGDVTKFISDSLQKAMEDLPKLVDALLRIVNSLIKSVADLFKDKKFVDTMVQSMIDTFNTLMDRLPDIIGSVVDLILSLITALVPKLPEIITAIIAKIVETIPKVINEIVDALGKAIGDIFSKIFTKEFWLDVFSQIGNAFGEIFSSIGNSLTEAVQGFGNVYNENPTVQAVVDTGAGIATGGLYNLGKWIGQQFGWWATGTNNAPSGLAVVGEAGPELVKFRGGEQVLNNRNTNKALANMSGTTINQNVTFNNLKDTTAYAMMNQLKQYNRQLAINGVI